MGSYDWFNHEVDELMAASHRFLIHYSLIYSTINLKQFLWYVALKIDDFSIEIVKWWDTLGQ